MFGFMRGASSFNHPLGDFDVSRVVSMDFMFAGARAFNQNISSWQPKRVTNMHSMFRTCLAFSQDLCDWGNILPTNTVTSSAFEGTACPTQGDPVTVVQDDTRISDPFCFEC